MTINPNKIMEFDGISPTNEGAIYSTIVMQDHFKLCLYSGQLGLWFSL